MHSKSALNEYIKDRIDFLRLYPTKTILDYAKDLLKSYSKVPEGFVGKSNLIWMMEYFNSSEFLDCDNISEIQITDDYKKGLELLAWIEYYASSNKNDIVRNSAKNSMSKLEQFAGCVD